MPLVTCTPTLRTLFHVVDTDNCMVLYLSAILNYERAVRNIFIRLMAVNTERSALNNTDTFLAPPAKESKWRD
jgi:hypothetical protein